MRKGVEVKELISCRRCNSVLSDTDVNSEKIGLKIESVDQCDDCISKLSKINRSFNELSKCLGIDEIVIISPTDITLDGTFSSSSLKVMSDFMNLWDKFV